MVGFWFIGANALILLIHVLLLLKSSIKSVKLAYKKHKYKKEMKKVQKKYEMHP